MTSIQIISKIKFSSAQMAKSMYICELPTGDSRSPPCLTIFIGSVDSRIHIYVAKDGIHLPTDGSSSGSTTEGPSHLDLFSCVGILPGHEEWVVCLAAVAIDCRTTMLASGSQDAKIRVWKIKATKAMDAQGSCGNSLLEQVTAFDEDDDETDGEQSADIPAAALTDEDNTDESRLQFSYYDDTLYSLYLESLLVGHEDWVTALQWMPQVSTTQSSGSSTSSVQPLRLFSTSMDRNMVVWAPDAAAGGIWVPVVRMGDIGGALGGSIGGNLLGFVAGLVSPDCSSVLGVGYGGSFHLWSSVDSSDYLDSPDNTATERRWMPVPFLTGHFGSVNDLTWSDREAGEYLVSVSSDQTCRLHAPLADGVTWREISRPQIHGYDLNCIAKACYAMLCSTCMLCCHLTHMWLSLFFSPDR
jgi:elongator complex protein 2